MASSNPSTPNINVPIRIEPTDEYKIQEISYDGQEKYILPLSMSENLSQLISRIDFNQPLDELREELDKSTAEDADNETKKKSQLPTGPTWPFESMRTKLRIALTEICVLNDVLAIAKEKKYMVFGSVNPKQTDQRPIVSMMAKKKALLAASQVLSEGASTLRVTTANDPSNFYDELKEMRQYWRLKQIGGTIIGDLNSFRPVGHRFSANSRFEVIKTEAGTRGPANQALSVKIPADLEGRAYVQVSIIKNDDISLVDLSSSANSRSFEPAREGTWQEKLEAAQNVLFCKELFANLAAQAVQYQFVIPTTVTGNQIILALFPEVKLYITLVHKTPNTKCGRDLTEGMKKLQSEHRPVFEHSLHQMLRNLYATMLKRTQGRDLPKEAGPCAIDKQTLVEVSRPEISLDKIVQQAQHLIMRQQTMEVIDTFATKIKDPLIISHWFCLNSPTTSIVRVDIVSHNNEILGRSHMLIYIGTRQLRVITRDCKNLLLGYEADELRHLLIWQSCLHQFIASEKLSRLLGWYTLILNYNVNVTRQELSSTAFSVVICSSDCTHMISIKSGPQFGLAVEVAQFKEGHSNHMASSLTNGFSGSAQSNHHHHDHRMSTNDVHENSIESILSSSLNGCGAHSDKRLSKLQDLVDNFREVDWDMMQGKDFLTKLELLMAALTEL